MSEPVTIVVRRHVRAGSEPFYEDWLNRLTSDAQTLEGYLGAQFQNGSTGIGESKSKQLPGLQRSSEAAPRMLYA